MEEKSRVPGKQSVAEDSNLPEWIDYKHMKPVNYSANETQTHILKKLEVDYMFSRLRSRSI